MSPKPILSQVDELLSTLKDLMPTIYQKETLESIIGLFLDGQGNAVPHHCQTKSESAISRFLNHYNWSTRSLIRTIRSFILNLVLSERRKGRKPILQVIIEGFFKTAKHQFSLHRFGQKTLLGVYRWLILSFLSYMLAYLSYLHNGNFDNLDWYDSAQKALVLLLPHILLLSLIRRLKLLNLWFYEHGLELCLVRCKM